MSLQTLAVQLRLELDDIDKTRWKDEQLLIFLNKAVRRVNQLAIRNCLDFAMKADDVVLKPDGTIEGIVYDSVNAVCGIYVDGAEEPMTHLLPMHYLKAQYCPAAACWTFLNGAARYKAAVPNDIPATFLHYPQVAISSTESPWKGRLDDLVTEYAAFRAKNVDEMTLQMDQKMMAELEQRLLENYNRLQPTIAPMRGWL
jgi:hypothetical protein